MEAHAIENIAQRLEAAGHDAGELHELQIELDLFEQSPSLWSRLSQTVRSFASRQWSCLAGEFQESQEAMHIIRKALLSRESVSSDEREFVREQLYDLLRVLPAGAVIFANAALPVPATSMLTPRILQGLGLMPSRWRERHLLTHLQSESDRLRAEGLIHEADEINEIREELMEEARCRVRIAREARLLKHWDFDGNGQWDPSEREAYEAAISGLVDRLDQNPDSRCWYLLEEQEVVGPLRPSAFPDLQDAEDILICQAEDQLWVSLAEVLSRKSG